MQDDRHGVQRLLSGETKGEEYDSPNGDGSEQAMGTFFDCKETPGSGCESAERLRLIRKGKQPVVNDGEFRSPRRQRDSLDWYSFCNDDGGCAHIGGGTGNPP